MGLRNRDAWTLQRRLRAVTTAFALLLLLAGTAVVLVLRQADHALSQQTQRSFPARVAASQLLTSLVDQETGLRGYALTQDKKFLDPYREGLVDEQAARARLDGYVAPRDPARLSLLTLDAAITAWRDQYATLTTAARDDVGTAITLEFGRELFDRVRETGADLDVQLAKEGRRAQDEADRYRRLVLVVLVAMAAVLVVGVVGLQRALRTAVLHPMRRLADQVAVVAGGDHGTPIRPAGPPDFRDMGGQVESMRQELVSVLAEVEAQQRGLERRAAELARSNADLEQFAYVASHDLQEPLRKVASFCQLLEQRYSGQLDERGEQYLAFAVDGAKRMQQLIADLLTFSRVGRTSEGFVPVDLAALTASVRDRMADRTAAAGGTVEVALAPDAQHVQGDPALLQLMMSNLLVNAVKYARPDVPPQVRVTSVLEGDEVRVDVADNGIGIPQEYAQKVFVIFQRLHGRDEYEGTGIGLALVKKVVEFHGGTIGLRPSPLGGACLSFTLPLRSAAPDDRPQP